MGLDINGFITLAVGGTVGYLLYDNFVLGRDKAAWRLRKRKPLDTSGLPRIDAPDIHGSILVEDWDESDSGGGGDDDGDL
eukprot:g60612.t1